MRPRFSAGADEPRVRVDVYRKQLQGRISPYVFGAGIDAGPRIARYPGGFVFSRNDHRGSWANSYWQDHIGRNPDGHLAEVYDLGTFIQLCERFGIEPLMRLGNAFGDLSQAEQRRMVQGPIRSVNANCLDLEADAEESISGHKIRTKRLLVNIELESRDPQNGALRGLYGHLV